MSMADLFYALAWPPVLAFVVAAVRRACHVPSRVAAGEFWTAGGVGVAVSGVFAGHWAGVVIGAVQVAIGVWLWRRGRRGRRRAPRAYGAKSRALVAVLVAKARDAARPRPVLRPVPGAA